MFAILINEKGGEQKRLDFDKPEVTIGRVQGNDIILPKGNVSKRHSRIVLKDGKFIIVDLKSTNGTYVNGRKITSPLVVKSSDKIYIGDFILTVEEAGGAAGAGAPAPESQAAPAAPPPSRPIPPPPPRPTRSSLPQPPAALRGDGAQADQAPAADESQIDAAPPVMEPERPARPSLPNLPPRPQPAAPPRPTEQAAPWRPAQVEAKEPPRPTLSSLDKPVVAGDRVSERATMMASEAPARPQAPPPAVAPPPVSAPPLQAPQLSVARPPVTRPPGSALGGPLRSTRPGGPRSQGPQVSPEDPQRRRHVDLLNQVVSRAVEQLGLQAPSAEQLGDASLAPRVENVVGDLVDKMVPLPLGFDADPLTKEAVAEIVGAGPLDDLLADETVHEIAVVSHDRIYVDRGTGQSLSDKVFSSAASVLRAVQRLAHRAGASMGGMTLGELRLDGGALLQVSLPPHARVPSLVLRRARKAGGRLQDLVNQGVLSGAMSEFLELCMRERRNFIISGYGRGVMLGALGGATAAGARVVTVEPVSELDLSGTPAAWIGLIARGADTRGVIGHACRLHPDHLLVTDVRGPEALDVAAALCGGQGVVVGVDAASARDAIARLESLGRLSGESPPRKALREELAHGLHLAVHVGRTAQGAYRVMEISEVTLAEEGGVELVPMFSFKPEGGDGQFVATGHVPAFAG